MNYALDIDACLSILHSGKIILYPTDTIWGIGCDATNAVAVARIYALKKRIETKAMIVLVAEERDILQYIPQLDLRIFDYLKKLQTPTTVIYDRAVGLADNLLAKDGSIAIRIVQDAFCKHLIKQLGKPLVSTSANISGHPSPPFFKNIDKSIINGVDYVVQYRRDDNTIHQPSSIIKWNADNSIEVIRK